MRKLVLLPALVLCALCAVAQAEGEAKTIKLCGREFIRAIVYTCGGSRWRRILDEPAVEGVGSLDQGNVESLSTSARDRASSPRPEQDSEEYVLSGGLQEE
ncbi:hypothetical protein AAFF_G00074580 [Aldrovandia affinis]|uniref:Insulin-like domain-containing protein n=1 Tax=Aldrovandia affinis TaxID=143900 RepID=A0AAD7WDH4_9TELE|nr:hypothetical protein AAFF_G00074580 [Aldrovandia affinis]